MAGANLQPNLPPKMPMITDLAHKGPEKPSTQTAAKPSKPTIDFSNRLSKLKLNNAKAAIQAAFRSIDEELDKINKRIDKNAKSFNLKI